MEAREQDERVRIVEAVVRHQTMIQSYAFAIVRDYHLAEDIFQEVALIVAKQWETVPAEQHLISWLKETTRRKSLEMLRKHRKPFVTLPEEAIEAIGEEFVREEGEEGHRERQETLHERMDECLEKLPEPARTIFRMRFGETLPRSCADIAAAVGRSVQAIYASIKRTRLALTKCVEGSATTNVGDET